MSGIIATGPAQVLIGRQNPSPIGSNFSVAFVGGSATITLNITGTQNNMLWVSVGCNGAAVNDMDLDGVGLTRLGFSESTTRAEIRYLSNPPMGSHVLTCHLTGSVPGIMGAKIFTGCKVGTGGGHIFIENAGSDTNPILNFTPPDDDSLGTTFTTVFDCMVAVALTTATKDSKQAQVLNMTTGGAGVGVRCGVSYYQPSAALPDFVQWTLGTSQDWTHVAAIIRSQLLPDLITGAPIKTGSPTYF